MMMRVLLAIVVTSTVTASVANAQVTPVKVTTVAYRVHNMKAMVAFYTEAFGGTFREVQTGPFTSQFGDVAGLVLKFVPIRDAADFENFPVHQLGFEVADVNRVIEIALKHGGRVQNKPGRDQGRVHAAIRDPDGNTLELYGPIER